MSSLVNITVTIIGSEHPVFEKQFYTVSVKEDVALYAPIISVKATSPNSHKLIYSITGGDPYKEFAVDFNIGKCFLMFLWKPVMLLWKHFVLLRTLWK